jgi:hypothetical protein
MDYRTFKIYITFLIKFFKERLHLRPSDWQSCLLSAVVGVPTASLLLLASPPLLLLFTLLLAVFFLAFFGCQLLLASLLLLTPFHIVAVPTVEYIPAAANVPAVARFLLLQGFCYCKLSAIAGHSWGVAVFLAFAAI